MSLPRIALLVVLTACAIAPEDPTLAFDDRPGDSIALLRDGAPVWRFHYGPERTKPCFHPLALPGGRVFTRDRPKDHRWHHGLWFSWKLIDGVNYWENAAATGRPEGRTRWQVTAIDLHPDHSARIALTLAYGPGKGAPVLTEDRVLHISPPAPDGAFHIDWSATFTATAATVTLDRTPLPGEPGGKVYGGYAGLSLRMVQMAERRAHTIAGPVTFNRDDRFRTRAAAFDYSGVLEGAMVGVAIFDHPDNLNAPSPWYSIRSGAMTFFTPAVLCYGPHIMARGDRFALRYRVSVHPGWWDGERLQREQRRFIRIAASER